jgi:hypothetical protein
LPEPFREALSNFLRQAQDEGQEDDFARGKLLELRTDLALSSLCSGIARAWFAVAKGGDRDSAPSHSIEVRLPATRRRFDALGRGGDDTFMLAMKFACTEREK